ncbi:MAG: glycosyltransferase family 4 protein [bacterium]
MNILHLTNELNHSDGVSSHLFYLLKSLKDQNIDSFILCGGGEAISKFENVCGGIFVYEKLKHENRSAVNFPKAILELRRVVNENNINILHSHNHYAAGIAFQYSRLASLPAIQTVHGIIPATGRLKHFAADQFIAVNDHVRDHVAENEPGKKVTIIYNGIKFYPFEKKHNTNKIRFIAASRLEKGKGLETYIRAAGILDPAYKLKAEFLLAGKGSLENELENLNKKLKAGIKFLGEITEMSKLFEETDVFVIPSENEGLPISLLEAATGNNLILSSAFDGVENIFIPDEEGILFKINDSEGLSNKIRFIIDNPEIIPKLSGNFYAKAKKKFNSTLMAEKHFELYTAILNKD